MPDREYQVRFGRRALISRTAYLSVVVLFAGCRQPGIPSDAIARIGYINGGSLGSDIKQFRDALRDLGRDDGTNVVIVVRAADGIPDRLPGMMTEMIALPADLLVTGGTNATVAAKHATTSTPIVFHTVADPVAQGIVASLARPGGNITGVAATPSPGPKRLEILRTLDPNLRTVAVLWNANNSGAALQLRDTQSAAAALGLELQIYGVHTTAELDTALDAIARSRPGALHVEAAFNLSREDAQVPEFAARMRLPATYATEQAADFVHAGGLIAIGANSAKIAQRVASLADRILKGERPADLPVELPTQLDIIVNLKAASRIGLVIPASVLAQATEFVR